MRPTRLPSNPDHDRVVSALRRMGFRRVREGKHSIYRRGPQTMPLPRHSRLARNTLVAALDRVGISEEEFMQHW